MTIFFENANVIKNKEKLKNCHGLRDTEDMTSKCNMGSETQSALEGKNLLIIKDIYLIN